MKKILILILVVTAIAASGQTTKGSFMLGGNGSLSFDNNVRTDGGGNPRSYSLGLSPTVGYFPVKNFAFGLSLPFEVFRSKASFNTAPPTESKGSGYSISGSPFIRYYIPIKKLFIVTQANYGWGHTHSENKTTETSTGTVVYSGEVSVKSKWYSFSAGPAFFLNPYTSIEILANYQSQDYDAKSTSIVQPYNQSTWYISLGFQIYLPSNRE